MHKLVYVSETFFDRLDVALPLQRDNHRHRRIPFTHRQNQAERYEVDKILAAVRCDMDARYVEARATGRWK